MRTKLPFGLAVTLLVTLCVLAALLSDHVRTSADESMTWEEFVEEYGAMPPPPPDASNTDVWVEPVAEPVYEDDGGGQSIADMNADDFTVDWTGQGYWCWT
jgi:hypothetical protein